MESWRNGDTGAITPSLHHSITPSLHHPITPSPHLSISPSPCCICPAPMIGFIFFGDRDIRASACKLLEVRGVRGFGRALLTADCLERGMVIGRRYRCWAGSAVRRLLMAATCAALLLGLTHCAGRCTAGSGARILHVKIVASPGIAAFPSWQDSISRLASEVSCVLQANAGVSLRVDTMVVWDAERAASYSQLLMEDCLVKEVPKDGSDIVVYISESGNTPSLVAGMTLYELGYAQVPLRMAAGVSGEPTYALTHWIAHMFGAVHCYYNKDNPTVMNPFIHDGMVAQSNAHAPRRTPKFHRGNVTIMRSMRDRPFDERQWLDNGTTWPRIQQTYNDVRHRYNQWSLNGDGELTDYQDDAFHEGNLLLYLSTWASLCGEHDLAVRYLDSVGIVSAAVQETCHKQGGTGNSRLCNVCGFEDSTATQWLKLQRFYLGMRRCIVELRAGNVSVADSCFEATTASLPEQMGPLREKVGNGYQFYRARAESRIEK